MAHRETDRHRQAFEVWWESDRSSAEIQRRFSVSERTAANWVDWFGWHARADARDEAVRARQDRDAVTRRVRMNEAHRKAGEALRQRGVQHLVRHEITNTRDAIAAVKAGVEIERTAEGLPTEILELLTADADTLRERAARIIASAGARTSSDQCDPGDEGGAACPGAGAGEDGAAAGE